MTSKNNINLESPPPTNLFHHDNCGEQNDNSNARGEDTNEEYRFITSCGVTGLDHLSNAEVIKLQTNNDNKDDNNGASLKNAAINEGVPDGKVACTNLEVSEDPPSSESYSSTNNRNGTNNNAFTNSEKYMVDKTTDQIIDIETAIINCHDDNQSSDSKMSLSSLIYANEDDENIYSPQLASNGNDTTKNIAVGGGIEVLNDLDNVSNCPIANSSASAPRLQSIPGDGDYDGNLKVAMMECQCCYVETEFEDMVSCREKGHLFCRTCVRKYVEERVFGLGNLGKTASASFEISCLHLSGCTSGFPEEQMHRVLPEKVMTKYDELRFMTAVEKAAMEDICKCPKCQYLASADESVVVFHCPQCNYKSCRKCGKEAHPQIRCNQVETKRETDGRKYVEEAMTKAKIRTCPKPGCNTEFYKSGGCNKITCPKCSTWICYICRSKIPEAVSYGHFCQTPHCQHRFCGKCPLHSNTEEDDKRAVREARLNAKRIFNGTETKKHVDVDVDSLLCEPSNGNECGVTGLGDAGRGGASAGAGAGAGAGAVVGHARRDDRDGGCSTFAGCCFIVSICHLIGIFIVIFKQI